MVIFFIIFAIIVIGTLLILCSKLIIDVKEFEVVNKKVEKFKIVISLALIGKIKWLKITIDNNRMQKLKNNAKTNFLNKLLDTKILKKFKSIGKIKEWKQVLKQLKKWSIENVKINASIGTENPAVTAITVGTISAILGIILAQITKTPQYEIKPIYKDKNYIYLSINCIISIKLVHIINMNKKLGKEVYQTYGRTSNRRAYANSNG